MIERLNKIENAEAEARHDLELKFVQSINGSIGQVIKALEGVAKRIDGMHKTLAKKPTL